jgi:hypothetical protein
MIRSSPVWVLVVGDVAFPIHVGSQYPGKVGEDLFVDPPFLHEADVRVVDVGEGETLHPQSLVEVGIVLREGYFDEFHRGEFPGEASVTRLDGPAGPAPSCVVQEKGATKSRPKKRRPIQSNQAKAQTGL